IGALKKLLEANRASLAPGARADDRVAEADVVAAAVDVSAATTATAKAAPIQDTAALDLADGKLYVAIKDLNTAAKKAIRAGALSAKTSEYTFHYLKNRKKKTQPRPE